MRKETLLSFLAGAVLPLALTAIFHQKPMVEDVERGSPTPTVIQTGFDEKVELTVKNRAGNLRQMPMDDYLTGVVLAEMPADFEPEALKAQAVVARTYTCKRMEGSKHGEAAVCMDPGCCQSWRSPEEYLAEGGRQSAVDKVRQAVADTDGLVLCYQGKLIDATYFSCSGGSTEDAVAVWGQDVPYLQAVDSPGEEDAPRFTDSVAFSAGEFAAKLGLAAGGDPADWFGAVTYTDGGGVDTMTIKGTIFTGVRLRSALGLRSTAFEVHVSGDTVSVTTRGFGHRVGMSQYGAQAMALGGSTCPEILAHYYTGTELTSQN